MRKHAIENEHPEYVAKREVWRRYSDLYAGGGLASEGEDIELMEVGILDAIDMIDKGKIVDAKTIMLLQYVKMRGVL